MLEVFFGPMKSGKSTKLLERISNLNSVVLFKPEIDTRKIQCRNNVNLNYKIIDETVPFEILNFVKDFKVVAFDEAQFFAKGFEEVVKKLLSQNKDVFVAGLDLDFRGEPFGTVPYLISIADKVHKLTAKCEFKGCNAPAERTQRLINGEPAYYNSPIILIGDEKEGYQPRCLKHYVFPKKD